MTPIGALMIEHRLIERMLRLLAAQVERIRADRTADSEFVAAAVDFLRDYADRCHHGKEEDILFRDLAARPLEEPLRRTLQELIAEHAHARELTGLVAEANERYRGGEPAALDDLAAAAGELVALYPPHIEKEDRHFFVPIMDCFTKQELADMLGRFWEFDRLLIHERYRGVVTRWEKPGAGAPRPPREPA
jgi:hemerythrin-like domain-containing protein